MGAQDAPWIRLASVLNSRAARSTIAWALPLNFTSVDESNANICQEPVEDTGQTQEKIASPIELWPGQSPRLPMIEQILTYLEQAAALISLSAVVVIVAGFALVAGRYVLRFPTQKLEQNFEGFRIELGRVLLLGIEILVLADVIETITVKPTFSSLAVLAFLVVVRTLLSWTLTLEIEGHWPWQTSTEDEGHA